MLISGVQRDYARQISGKAVKLGEDSRVSPGNNGLISQYILSDFSRQS